MVALVAGGTQIDRLAEQVRLFAPARVGVPSERVASQLSGILASTGVAVPPIVSGPDAAARIAASGADVVLNALTGFAGLEPTLAALDAGSSLALANKESLVVGGRLVTDRARPGQIVPVDSEHSAIAQCLRSGRAEEVVRLVLTASGGPFRGWSREQLAAVTPGQALAHPTWRMGRVVTINSATLVNKGLELIEAQRLFGVGWDRIDVVVHPQSVVHSMVEFRDGATIASCSPPDMRLPIALGLTWPDRLAGVSVACDWREAVAWTFEPLDNETFPAVELARRVGRAGGTAPAVFNAANEVCVDAFCSGNLGFLGILDTVTAVVEAHVGEWGSGATGEQDAELTLGAIHDADAWARAEAARLIGVAA